MTDDLDPDRLARAQIEAERYLSARDLWGDLPKLLTRAIVSAYLAPSPTHGFAIGDTVRVRKSCNYIKPTEVTGKIERLHGVLCAVTFDQFMTSTATGATFPSVGPKPTIWINADDLESIEEEPTP